MKYAIKHFEKKKPASISIATLLIRDTTPEFDIPTYDGLMLHDEWVIGYGLNGEGGYSRNLLDIYKL
jgi:hypoxanthine-guanine phosphoribosyltransferase